MIAKPSSTSPDPRVQAPPGVVMKRSFEGFSPGWLALIVPIGFVLLFPWIAGFFSRVGSWVVVYVDWAFKIASGQ